MKNLKKIISWWILALLWMGVIYYFSAQPSLKSELQPIWDLIARKLAHMAEFFVLAYLFFKAYSSLGFTKIRSIVFALTFSIIYAIFDEWHQRFVSGRVASITDILIDSLGILIFGVLEIKAKNQ